MASARVTVQCFGYGEDEQKGHVVVQENVRGPTLRTVLANPSTTAADLVGPEGNLGAQVNLLEQLARALAECHRVKVVHKDLKPENIIMTESGGVWAPKIIDFGLSSIETASPEEHVTNTSFTTGYVAPEKYEGEYRRSPADIYSLGVIAYEVLAGCFPFPAEALACKEAQLKESLVPLADRRPEIPTALSSLVGSMLARAPAERPSAYTLAEQLPISLKPTLWTDWKAQGMAAYVDDGDSEEAVSHLTRAALAAPPAERRGEAYAELFTYLVDAAADCKETITSARSLVPQMVSGALDKAGGLMIGQALAKLVGNLLDDPAADPGPETKRESVAELVELLYHAPVNANTQLALEQMLSRSSDPFVQENLEDLYLTGLRYRGEGLIRPGLLESLCLKTCQRHLDAGEPVALSQSWLRRAERLGVSSNKDYIDLRGRLEEILRRTASPEELPAVADTQLDLSKVVGDSERKNLDVERIQRWVAKLYDLFPWVQGVRRVRKDGKIPPFPTRLEETVPAIHASAAKGVEQSQLIAAVLDASYDRKKAVPLRINIILPPGTRPSQREAALKELRRSRSMFGEIG